MKINRPAFPIGSTEHQLNFGLTKREYIAAMAMQGLLANYSAQQDMQSDPKYNGENFSEIMARNSIDFADALLKELEK